MNLIGSVAQRLKQKENKVSFLIRTAALLAGIRATGKMNNLSLSNPQRSATKSSKPFTFGAGRRNFWVIEPAFLSGPPPRPTRLRRDLEEITAVRPKLAAPLTPSLHYLNPERNRKT